MPLWLTCSGSKPAPERPSANAGGDDETAVLRRRLRDPLERTSAAHQLSLRLRDEGKVWLAAVAALLATDGSEGVEPPDDIGVRPDAATAAAVLIDEGGPVLARARESYARRLAQVEMTTFPNLLTPVELAELSALMLAEGVAPEFLRVFDHAFYWNAHGVVRSELAAGGRAECIRHYFTRGVERGLSTDYDAFLEVDFYNETYPSAARGSAAATWRWISGGVTAGHLPNRLAWARSAGLQALRSVSNLDLVRICAAHLAPGVDPSWAACLKHLLAGGTADLAWLPALDAAGVHFLVTVADFLKEAGHLEPAADIYEAVYARSDGPTASARYADLLFRSRRWAVAAEVYERLGEGEQDLDSAINRATCYQQLGRWGRALEIARLAEDRFGEDPRATAALHLLCRGCLEAAWRRADVNRRFDLRAVQDVLTESCRLVRQALAPRSRLPTRRVRRVALVAELSLPQCRFYRVEQRTEQIAALGLEAEVFDLVRGGAAAFATRAGDFDAVIFYRAHAEFETLRALSAAEAFGLHTFYEIDDLTFEPEVFPPPLDAYGGLISPEQYAGLQMAAPLQLFLLQSCAHAIASTATIAEAMRPHNTSVFIHANGLDRRHAEVDGAGQERVSTGLVTIFCGSGSAAHSADIGRLLGPMAERLTANDAPPVFFVLAGEVVPPPALAARPDLYVRIRGFQERNLHWRRLQQADINLVPLDSTKVTDGKSAIRWLEAALFAVPTVAGATSTHLEVITPGVTGLIARTPREWSDAVWSLVNSSDDRRRIGEAARREAKERFSAERLAGELGRIFASVEPDTVQPPRKIALVNVFYPPQARGGATRVVHDNATDLSRLMQDEADVIVFCSRAGGVGSVDHQISHYVQDGIRVQAVSTAGDNDLNDVYDDPKMEAIFEGFLSVEKPDLVHFHCIQRLGVGLCRAAQRRGIPYVITFHDAWWISSEQFFLDGSCGARPYDYDRPAETLRRDGPPALDRLVALAPSLAGAAQLLAVSEPFAELARGTGLRSVVALPNGGPAPSASPVRPPSREGRVVLGFLGGVSLHKGFFLFRLAVLRARLPRTSIVVVDHGLASGDSYVETWGGTTVRFRSRTPQSEMRSLYEELDVLVAPSIWPESYGLVAREAAAAGLWVVASDRGAMAGDLSPGVNGFVVSVDDPGPLADMLEQIDANPERFTRSPPRSGGGPTRTAWEQASDLRRLYLSVLSSAGASAPAAD